MALTSTYTIEIVHRDAAEPADRLTAEEVAGLIQAEVDSEHVSSIKVQGPWELGKEEMGVSYLVPMS